MLCHSLAWRKLHRIDRLHETYRAAHVIDKYYPGGWHYYDKGKYLMFFHLMKIIFAKNHYASSITRTSL
jgi:hypothetical protein